MIYIKHGHSSLILCVSRDTKALGPCTRATVLWHRKTPRRFSPPTLARLQSSLGESRQLPGPLRSFASSFCNTPEGFSASRAHLAMEKRGVSALEAVSRPAVSSFFAPFDTPYALAQGSHACDQRHACHRHRRGVKNRPRLPRCSAPRDALGRCRG